MGALADLAGAMRDAFVARAREDAEVQAFARHATVIVGIAGGEHGVAVRLGHGDVDLAPLDEADVVMRADEGAWDACLAAQPAPTFHHYLAMRMRVPGTAVESPRADAPDAELVFAQHAHVARRLVEIARATLHGERVPTADPVLDRSGISSRYVTVDLDGDRVQLAVDEAGDDGLPTILVLHTAGADRRQGHPLMGDADLLATHRVVAFDLPGHGASERLPHPFGAWTLTTERYVATILAVIDALGLDRPILLGASMAGEACLAMAHAAPDRLGGVVACEASEHVPGRTTRWPLDPRVNAMAFTPEWIDGLIGPDAPASRREDIRWQYSQGGLGTFPGDIDFYSGDWDGRDIVADIDTSRCPVVMMTGEYDYSCTPAMSEATAARIPGAAFWTMPGLGHFPVCEHPAAFAPHLRRALDIIEGALDA